MPNEYAQTVNYRSIEPFKRVMIAAGKKTLQFPNRRGVYINSDVLHSHGAVFKYRGEQPYFLCQTQEGLGNKNWIAEWMYQFSGTGETHYRGVAVDAALLIANDLIAQGAMPVVWTDEVAAPGKGEWFEDEKRSNDYAEGCVEICQLLGMALPAGESPALRYLLKSEPPVLSAPSLSGCITGIIAPETNLITGLKLSRGDSIIGVTSSGLHANGVSLVIKRALSLPDKFMTKLPNGNTLGEEALIPTSSYVRLVEALQEHPEVDIHALLPGTGSGVGKLAFDDRPFTYRVHTWPKVPVLFQYMRELGVSLRDCLTTFNWGVGYYIFVSAADAQKVISIGRRAGYDLLEVGRVEKGDRKTIFEPEGETLPPPGE